MRNQKLKKTVEVFTNLLFKKVKILKKTSIISSFIPRKSQRFFVSKLKLY